MKTSKFLFLAITMVSLVFTSCSKDETPEPEKPTKTVYLLKNITTVNGAWGTFVDDLTYNTNMQLVRKISSWGTMIDTLDYQYDASNRISRILQNGSNYIEYNYLEGVILEKTFDSKGYSTVQYTLNAAGKAVRSQNIDSDNYITYEWVNGNMTRKNTFENAVVVESDVYEYDLTVKDLSSEMFLGTLTAMCSLNGVSKVDEGNVSYLKNAAGYMTKAVTPTIFGDFTQNFTYETKTIVIE